MTRADPGAPLRVLLCDDHQIVRQGVRQLLAEGGTYVTPAVAEALVSNLGRRAEGAPHETLSTREDQVFRLLASGQSVGAIAATLSLSPNTVSNYRARILETTGARNDVELALYAVRHGLLSP